MRYVTTSVHLKPDRLTPLTCDEIQCLFITLVV